MMMNYEHRLLRKLSYTCHGSSTGAWVRISIDSTIETLVCNVSRESGSFVVHHLPRTKDTEILERTICNSIEEVVDIINTILNKYY